MRPFLLQSRLPSQLQSGFHQGAREAIEATGAEVLIDRVAGSYELPYGAQVLLESGKVDAVVAIGCLVKGATMHFEYICEAVTQGIMRLNLDYKMPVIFGVLAVMTEDQAKERAGLIGTHGNSGKDWGNTAVQLTFFFPYDDKLRS